MKKKYITGVIACVFRLLKDKNEKRSVKMFFFFIRYKQASYYTIMRIHGHVSLCQQSQEVKWSLGLPKIYHEQEVSIQVSLCDLDLRRLT